MDKEFIEISNRGKQMKCIKCGKPLQQVLFGIAHEFKNPSTIKGATADEDQVLVCTNPQCEDGKHNNGMPKPEDIPF